MLILAVDPATISGYCISHENKIILHGETETNIYNILNILKYIENYCFNNDIMSSNVMLVIEDQYYDKKKENPHTFKTVIEMRMRWQALCEERGYRIEAIMPSQWQGGEIGSVQLGRETLKYLSQAKAQALFKSTVQENEADAINIAKNTEMKIRLGIPINKIKPKKTKSCNKRKYTRRQK